MTDPEPRWTKIRGVTLALIFGAVIGACIGLWAGVSWVVGEVIGAFAELGQDFKLMMKGG